MSYLSTGPQPVKFHKPFATETADIHSRVGGTRAATATTTTTTTTTTTATTTARRRHRPQIRNGVRQAALQADTGFFLVRQHGFSIAEAARRTGSNPTAIEAMAILHDYGDPELLAAVLVGEVPFLPTAARLKPLVKATKAFERLSIADQIEFARRQDPERLFSEVIVPASTPAPVNLVVET